MATAAHVGMYTHARIQAALAHLAAMLPEWTAHLRHPAEFRPQSDALALASMLASDAIDARLLPPRTPRRTSAPRRHAGLTAWSPWLHGACGHTAPYADLPKGPPDASTHLSRHQRRARGNRSRSGADRGRRVTATAICGSDLHLYRGKIPDLHSGDVLGHEFMGVVEDVGPDVQRVKKGDRVVIPFVIACGECFHCRLTEYAACEASNTGKGAALNQKGIRLPAALFGYSHLYGGVAGGQAEYVRVKANVGPLVVPDVLHDEQVLFLSDILPTGYQAALNAGVRQGGTVAIFGAGPVGLMTAACCRMLGAERIFLVDRYPYRLQFAQKTYGVIPLNFEEIDDPADIIVGQTDGRGVDASIHAVGFEAKGSTVETVMATLKLEGSSGTALRQCIAATRSGGTISVPGVYAASSMASCSAMPSTRG